MLKKAVRRVSSLVDGCCPWERGLLRAQIVLWWRDFQKWRFRAILRNASGTMKKNVFPKIDGKAVNRWIPVVHDRQTLIAVSVAACLLGARQKPRFSALLPNFTRTTKKKSSGKAENTHKKCGKTSKRVILWDRVQRTE